MPRRFDLGYHGENAFYVADPTKLCAEKSLRPEVVLGRTGALSRPGTRLWLWLFVALLAGHAAVIVASPHPPLLQDYPDWVYQSVLFGKLVARHPVPGYALKHYPVPNSTTTIGLGLLSLAVGWQAAAKLWLLLVVAALGAACFRLVRRLGGQGDAVLPIFAASVVAGVDLWNGSINFQLSLALFLFLLAHLLQPKASAVGTALLLLGCFFTHMLPCGAGMLALAVIALQERNPKRLLPALPTLVCVVWYALSRDPGPEGQSPLHLLPAVLAMGGVLFWAERASARSQGAMRRSGALSLVWPPLLPTPVMLVASKVFLLFGWLGPLNVLGAGAGGDRVLWPVAVFWSLSAVGIVAAVLGGWTLGSTWMGLCRSRDPRRFLAVTALALTAMFALSPSDALGVTPIDSRFLHLGIAAGLGVLCLQSSRRATILGWIAVLVGCVNLVQFAVVQFQPATVSVPGGVHVLLGVSPVAPAVRSGYYDALAHSHYGQWIFPTAMFRRMP